MERKKAGDFDQELLDIYDDYVHGVIDRRGFLERAARFAIGGLTAAAVLDLLTPRFAEAEKVKRDDPRLDTVVREFPSPQGHGRGRGSLVLPASRATRLPGVLVVHENRGLNPHIEDVARRVALEGFVAFAPDALAPIGGYPGDEDRARTRFASLDRTKVAEDMLAAARFLEGLPECTGKIGVVGFCFGGGIANRLAVRMPTLHAAVAFYGGQPDAAEVASIRAPILLQYADKDERINAGIETYEAALKAHGVRFMTHRYPGTQHGFHNDTTPRYDEAAAALAWQRTIAFLRQHLA